MGYGTTRSSAGGGFTNTLKGGVTISISTKEVERRMRRMRERLPKMREQAFKTQMKTILSHLKKVLAAGGGVYDVPKFKGYEPFTKELRAYYGTTGRMGGRIAEPTAVRYDALTPFSSPRPRVRVGWHRGFDDALIKFQTGAGSNPDPFADAKKRARWHRIGIDDVPTRYVHNERQIVIPFEVHVTKNLQKWIDGYVRRRLAHEIAKETRKAMA